MAKYGLVYHGGADAKPEGEEGWAKMMEAWQNWVANMGADLVDPGNAVSMSKTVMSDGTVVDNGGSNPITGYCLISADNMEDALSKAKGLTYFLATGVSIEVAEMMEHN